MRSRKLLALVSSAGVVVLFAAGSASADAATVDNGVSMSCDMRQCTFRNAMNHDRTCAYTIEVKLVSGKVDAFNGAVTLASKGWTQTNFRPSGWSTNDTAKRAELKCTGPN
jgi:hypothetical protein